MRLEKIRYKNLLSTGNNWIEIDLSSVQKTLIVGPNGSGKTTLIEALCLALYNKPFRKVNRAKLVNSITNKGLEIELQFSTPAHHYLVRRGIKPNLFEVYEDDKLI